MGLARELREEIGIEISTPRPLMRLRHRYPDVEVLLDIWVVRHYRGEPSGFDGQALRWCTRAELESADLLPADQPIVAALKLPERLTEVSTPHFMVVDSLDASIEGRRRGILCGVFCRGIGEAVAAAGAGADFLVLRGALLPGEIAAISESVAIPVYARGIELHEAWALGASGVSEVI